MKTVAGHQPSEAVTPDDTVANWLLRGFKGSAIETLEKIGELQHTFVSFIDDGPNPLAGHGHDQSRDKAVLKALVEKIERQAMREAFRGSEILARPLFGPAAPAVLHRLPSFENSNGWAVHLSEPAAIQNAFVEALERHILTVSYLQLGWRGFSLIDKTSIDGFEVLSLASCFTCEGYRAGLVVLKSAEFPGVAFGYTCAPAENLLTGDGWTHALFEAIGYLKRMKHFKKRPDDDGNALFQISYDFLMTPWSEPEFSESDDVESLPRLQPLVATSCLTEMKDATFALYSAFVFGGGLVPLVIGQPKLGLQMAELSDALSKLGLNAQAWPDRLPVL